MELDKLSEPFAKEDIEWRIQRTGVASSGPWAMVLAYVTNRAVQQRLDEVCGAGNWQNEFKESPDGGVLCGISICNNDRWVTKYDGAENTQVEAVKGGLSGAMKRAAVQWGIGRYLYKLDANFVQLKAQKDDKHTNRHYDAKDKKTLYWATPELPTWALPEVTE